MNQCWQINVESTWITRWPTSRRYFNIYQRWINVELCWAIIRSVIEARNWVFVVLCQLSLQGMTFRCVVTDDYGLFSYRQNSRVVLLNQNVHAKELNPVLSSAFRSNNFKTITRQYLVSNFLLSNYLVKQVGTIAFWNLYFIIKPA